MTLKNILKLVSMLKKRLRCIGLYVTRTCKSSVYIETSTLITGVRGDRHSLILFDQGV